MKTFFDIKDGALVESTSDTAKVLIYAVPDGAEKQELLDILPLDRHALESALDPDEISRVEFTPEYTYMIWKRPRTTLEVRGLIRRPISPTGKIWRDQ